MLDIILIYQFLQHAFSRAGLFSVNPNPRLPECVSVYMYACVVHVLCIWCE